MIYPTAKQLEIFKVTPGAFSVCEMVCLHNLANLIPENGSLLDLGTNASKAALAFASGLASNEGAEPRSMFCIDPIFSLDNREAWSHSIQGVPENCPWAWAHDPEFVSKVKQGIWDISCGKVEAFPIGDYSENAIPKHGTYAWAFIDTDDHQEELLRSELALLKDRMAIGGIIGFHDFGNYPAVERVMREFLSNGCYQEVPIDWDSIREFVRVGDHEKDCDSWHCRSEELPCHVAAIRRIK